MTAVQKMIRGRRASEIAADLERAMREGRLPPGEKLPTVRALAEALGVSPTTVAAAFRILRERGLLVTDGRRGTRVSPAPPVATPAAAPPPPGTRDLATGNPDPALLPDLGPHLARLDAHHHLYGDAIHDPELLSLARARLEADGILCPALSIVSGAMDGIERVLEAHLRPGDRVAVEDPGFTGVLHLVPALGLVMQPVPVDDAGLRPDGLEAALRAGARAVILTPRAQNPTGAALDARRERELRALLARHPEAVVIEDDHAAEASGSPARSVASAVTHFALVRSVSKTLGPDLRLAVLAGDEETVARVEGRQLLGLRWVSHLLQGLVVSLWRDEDVVRGLAEAAATLAARREALLTALAAEGIAAHGRSGFNVWVPVPQETLAVQALAAAGYAVRAGEVYRIDSQPGIRITTASLPGEEAPALAAALATAIRPSARDRGA